MLHENNILNKIIVYIPAASTQQSCKNELNIALNAIDEVYSYLIYVNYVNLQLDGWQVEFMVSQTERLNTISKTDAVQAISIMINNWQIESAKCIKYVVGYKQPPLDLLLEIFEPLIKKLAMEQHRHWNDLEYEDLMQMCGLVICILYNKGYYIHKKLINKAFTNYVLNHIRKNRYKPIIQSLDEVIGEDGDNAVFGVDLLADELAELTLYEKFEYEHHLYLLQQKRDLIIEHIGERQYDQLLREYGNKMTTNFGAKKVHNIKKWLSTIGISDKLFR